MTLPAVDAKLNVPDHRIIHRIIDVDVAAAERTHRIDSSANTGLGVDPTSKLDVAGDVEVGSADNHFFGDPTTDGSWKIVRSGNKISLQRRESGSYVEKEFFDASFDTSIRPGWIRNIGINLSGGVFTVVGGDGVTALSASNPGYIAVASATGGKTVILKVTVGGSFKDDVNASSDLTNWGAGITETADWATDMPWFLNVVNRNDTDIDGTDGNSAFLITRDPTMCETPAAAGRIGDTDAIPATDDQDSIILLGSFTTANYTDLESQIIGGFVMQWSSANTDWTVQAIAENHGIGMAQLDKLFATIFTFPLGQNGAAAGTFIYSNGGTAPIFTTNTYIYTIDRMGKCTVFLQIDGDGGTDGAGAVDTVVSIPYSHGPANANDVGLIRMNSSVTGDQLVSARVASSTSRFFRLIEGGGGTVQNSDFGNGGRHILGSFTYQAY